MASTYRKPSRAPRPILLVDDDTSALEAFSLLLEVEGFRVVAAARSLDALVLLDTVDPAAIVMDLVMPGMDGFAFRERQLSIPARREVPFIVMSGAAQPVVASRLGIPVDHCFVKPVDPALLVATLRRCCS
jgi:CheY-like chemotaxis protein